MKFELFIGKYFRKVPQSFYSKFYREIQIGWTWFYLVIKW